MQLLYGAFPFDFNSTLLAASQDTNFNTGGQPYSQTKRIDVEGTFSVASQADATLKESALRTALSVNFQNLTFYQDSGLPSALYLNNLGSITGVRINHLRFPKSMGPEYATIRSFAFTAEAEYPLPNSGALLLEFRETLDFEGGLPIYRHRLALNGPAQKQLVYPQDTYRAVQSGTAVGYQFYPSFPPPTFPFALKEGGKLRRTGPTRKGPAGYEGFGISWSYQFEDAGVLDGTPQLWTN